MPLLTTKQLGAELNLRPKQVQRLALAGKIPAYRYNSAWRFDLAQVLAATARAVSTRSRGQIAREDVAAWRLRASLSIPPAPPGNRLRPPAHRTRKEPAA